MSSSSTDGRSRKPFYAVLYLQVLAAIAVAVALGHFWPAIAVDMKPFGDAASELTPFVD
jgi:aerobic C4-dicarboxylate transport protein